MDRRHRISRTEASEAEKLENGRAGEGGRVRKRSAASSSSSRSMAGRNLPSEAGPPPSEPRAAPMCGAAFRTGGEHIAHWLASIMQTEARHQWAGGTHSSKSRASSLVSANMRGARPAGVVTIAQQIAATRSTRSVELSTASQSGSSSQIGN